MFTITYNNLSPPGRLADSALVHAWLRAALVVMAASGLGTACATANGGARPMPFPSAPAPLASPAPTPTTSATLVDTALGLRGVPYRLGGDSPRSGLDCSGLVRYVFAQHGIDLPRTVAEQHRVGRRVGLDQIAAGDLIFFTTTGPGATHVGIALGGGSAAFVHAPAFGGEVRVERFDGSYWRPRIVDVRRIG